MFTCLANKFDFAVAAVNNPSKTSNSDWLFRNILNITAGKIYRHRLKGRRRWFVVSQSVSDHTRNNVTINSWRAVLANVLYEVTVTSTSDHHLKNLCQIWRNWLKFFPWHFVRAWLAYKQTTGKHQASSLKPELGKINLITYNYSLTNTTHMTRWRNPAKWPSSMENKWERTVEGQAYLSFSIQQCLHCFDWLHLLSKFTACEQLRRFVKAWNRRRKLGARLQMLSSTSHDACDRTLALIQSL